MEDGMTSTLVRGKYVICKVTGPSSAEVVYDGAVLQQDGEIVEVGSYEEECLSAGSGRWAS